MKVLSTQWMSIGCCVFSLLTMLRGCDGCGNIGTSNPGAHITTTGTGTGLTFFVGTPASPCCGTLNNWKFYVTSSGDVTMYLWRPTATAGSYELMAQQTFTATVGLNTPLPTSDVEVDIGDVIGWYTSGTELIPSSVTAGSSTQSQVLAAPVVAAEVPWTMPTDTANTYAAGAVVAANEVPVIVDDSVTITDSMTSQPIFTIDVTDADTNDLVSATSGFSVTKTSGSALFSVVKTATGYDIRSGASLSAGSYPLQITATDRCGDTAVGTITVTVTNTEPVFVPNPLQTVHPTSISDVTTSAKSLYAFDVTDTDPITCTVDNAKFEIKTVGAGYELWLKAGSTSTLNYDVSSSEAMTITCDDRTDQITSSYTVDILDATPVLTNLAGTYGPVGDLSPVGTSVHRFTVTDQDDVISCSINAPESTKFGITAFDTAAGTQRFDVKTIAALDYDSTTSYTVTVSCNDGINTVTSSGTINIADDKPVFSGLPATLSPARNDGLQTATLLHTFSVTDANDQSAITCSIQAPQNSLFNVISGTAPTFSIWVKAGVTLTAGSTPSTINVDCVDDRSPANTVTETFTVPLVDTPPTFVSGIPGNSPSISDSTVTATSLGAFIVTDPATTCSITSPVTSAYEIKTVTPPADPQEPEFEVWIKTTVTQASIDFNDQPVPLTLTIRCSDGNVANDITGTFNVNIVDEPPVITALPATGTAINDGLQAAATLHTFSVTDSDDTVTCSVRAPENALFEVVAATNPAFNIRVKAAATLAAADGPYVINVDCQDNVNVVSSTFTQPVIDTPPTFVSGIPGSSPDVSDATVTATQLGKFTTTDPDTTCSVTSPAATVYEIRQVASPANPLQPEFQVWIKSTVTQASIDFNDQPVPLTLSITCSDGNVANDITGTFDVNIVDEPPVITALPASGTAINDGLQAVATLHTFSVTDSDDTVTCSVRAPEDARFEVVAAASPALNIRVKAGVTLAAAVGPYVMNVDCQDNVNVVSSTFTQPVTDTPPTFVSGIPGASPDVSDATVSETQLGTFTTTDPDTTCSVTSPATTVYEIRQVTSPTNPLQPEFEVWIKTSVTQASIDFDDQAVPLRLTITCSDGNVANDITGTFNVSIVDEPPLITALPATGTDIFDGLKTAAVTLTTFSVTDSDDTVTCSVRAPEDALFEVMAATAPAYEIKVKAGVTLKAADGPYIINVDCQDNVNVVSSTFTQPVIDTPPTFVSGIPGSSPDVSDATVTETQLGTFTTTDPDTTCSVTSPATTVFEIRKVTSPANPLEPEFEVWIASTVTEADIDFNDQPVPLTLTITCTDGNPVNVITGSFNVNIVDEDPVLTSFPTTSYQFLEDTSAAALQLNKFSVQDSDDVISCQVDPATSESTHFEIKPGTTPEFQIWYKGSPPASLNYDVTPVHNVTIICNDGNIFSATYLYTVELENSPPVFVNLPATTLPSIAESVTSKTLLYVLTVSDLGVPPCYLSDTALAAGILPLEQSTVTPPETEYLIYAHNPGGFDFEGSSGAVNVEVTCGDSMSTVRETLIVNIDNSAPVINNQGGSSNVSEDVSGTVTLKTLDFVTFDKADVTCSTTSADDGPFDVIANQIVKTAGALNFETKATYNIDVTCTDGLLQTTDTYVVNVLNVGPEITSLPSAFAGGLDEEQTTELRLTTLTLTEDASDCVQTSPTYDEFNVKYEPTTDVWVIYYVSEAVAGRPLSYDTTPTYNLHIQCSDAAGAKGAEKIFTVHINDNQAPVIDNLSRSPISKLSLVAKDFSATDTVFTATGNDVENNDVIYSMLSCIPNATCPFIMSPNGDIVTTADLHSYKVNSFQLSVVATDKYNRNPTPYPVIVEITDINAVPKLTNVPKKDVVAVYENNNVGDVIYDVEHEDPDTGDVIKYFCNFVDGGADYFECDSATGEIRAKSVINFEKVKKLSYEVEVHAYDGYDNSTTETLTLLVSDVNEEPEFQTTSWTITKNDEGGPGEQIDCPDFKNDIEDEDVGDVHTYKMTCPRGGGVFVMDPLTGCVTMTKEWDLDAANKRLGEETIVCTVTATDRRGLETTAAFNIKIKEEDDNKPYLSQTSYVYCATVGATSGTLGQVTVTDNDVLAAHKTKKYEFVGSGPFYASGTGSLTYGDLSAYPKGTKFETTLRVTDSAGHYDESPVTIFICDPVPASSRSSASGGGSSASATSGGLDNFLYWLIPALLLLALMAGLAVFLIRRCVQGGRCGSCYQPSRTMKTIRPIQEPSRGHTRVITAREVEERHVVSRKAPTPSSSSPPPPPPPPTEKGTIAPCELPIVHYHARDVGNLGAMYPKS